VLHPGHTRPSARVRRAVETCHSCCVTDQPPVASDALLGMLFPIWQLAIGLCLLAVVVLSVRRLAARGPSRMTTALLVTGGAVVGLTVLGVLLQGT
jgi:hypothetical protein